MKSLAFLLTLAACEPAAAPTATNDKLAIAVDGPQRSAENRARDGARHPKQTLGFFGLKDNMTVLEIEPGGGWYTEILAPMLADHGKLFTTDSKEIAGRIKSEPNVFGKVTVLPEKNFGADDSMDLVLTFRNVHNWLEGGEADRVFASSFRVLKHGGTLGVVEHRAKPGTDLKTSDQIGYMAEDAVVAMVTKAGFVLDAKSEINANPKDSADHPGGVWALPPSYANKAVDREKYAAIGESDRMTMRFKKP